MALSGVMPSRYDTEIFNMKSNSVKPKKPRYMIGKSLLLSFCLAASFTVSGAEQEQSELELYTQFLERYEKYSQSQASAVFDISRESVQARAQQAEALLAEVQSIDCLLYTSPSPRDRG